MSQTTGRRSIICQECNWRPVMDRCSICEECWYAPRHSMRSCYRELMGEVRTDDE